MSISPDFKTLLAGSRILTTHELGFTDDDQLTFNEVVGNPFTNRVNPAKIVQAFNSAEKVFESYKIEGPTVVQRVISNLERIAVELKYGASLSTIKMIDEQFIKAIKLVDPSYVSNRKSIHPAHLKKFAVLALISGAIYAMGFNLFSLTAISSLSLYALSNCRKAKTKQPLGIIPRYLLPQTRSTSAPKRTSIQPKRGGFVSWLKNQDTSQVIPAKTSTEKSFASMVANAYPAKTTPSP